MQNLQFGVFIVLVYFLLFVLLGRWLHWKKDQAQSRSLGTGWGITHLLARWITPVTFLGAAEAAYRYGISGLVGFSLFGVTGFSLFAFWLIRSKGNPLGGHFKGSGSSEPIVLFDGKVGSVIRLLMMVETLMIAGITGYLLIEDLFMLSREKSILLFLPLFWLLLFLRSKGMFHIYPIVQVGLVMIGVMIVPALVYLNVSIPTVYSGVHFLATEMLQWNNRISWLFVAAMGVISIGHIMIDPTTWTTLYRIRKDKRVHTFQFAGLMWLFVPLSFGSLAFAAKAQAIWPSQLSNTALLVVQNLGGGFGFFLFTITLWTVLLSSTFTQLRDTSIFSPKGLSVILYMVVPAAALGAVYLFNWTVLQILLFFGMLWGVLLPLGLIGCQILRLQSTIVSIGIASSLGIAGWTLFSIGLTSSTIAGFLSSVLYLLLMMLYRWGRTYRIQGGGET